MKYPLILLFTICFFQLAQAQDDDRNRFAISAGFELGIPNQSIYSIGLGGSLKAEVPIAHHFSLTATGGITSLDYKNGAVHELGTPNNDTFVPLKGGVKYYASPGFYFEGELGNVIETEHFKQNLFAYSIGPGFVIPVNHGKTGVDIGFRYESWSKNVLRETGLRVAYRFGW
jgi:hypothetical protein